MSVQVRLLGRPRVSVGGRGFEPPADRRSALLYYLAHAGGWVPRDDLLYLFWPDSEERKGRANLRQLLMVVRDAPFGVGLEVERTRVRWPVATDLAAWAAAPGGDAAGWRWPGGLLEGFRLAGAPEFDSWLEIERAAWSECFRAALLGRAAEAVRDGGEDAHGAALEAWLQVEPLDEEALRAWMVIAGRRGRRTAALGRFAAFEAQLRAELGVGPEAATAAVALRLRQEAEDAPGGARGLRDGAARPASIDPDAERGAARTAPRWQLPRRPTSGPFFGRGDELARLADELLTEDGSVVTLLAPGGMGKTRLAREAAERLAPHFADGAVFVALAGARDAADIAPVFAEALGLALPRDRAPDAVVGEDLRDRHLLVVLDNLEQIAGAAARVDCWRELAPRVAWLLTSRARVGVHAESVLELAGLSSPSDDDGTDSPAIELLLRRARRAGIELDRARDAPSLARVVRLTGGMPLAIELAAGWLRVLPLSAIADELAAGIDLLEAQEPTDEPRHASLRSVFDAAWEALSEAERAALVRLAAFRGGFDEAAARDVARVGRPLLLALSNRSMLALGADGRFGWHPLLETYLRERATAEPAHEGARERHARHFLALLERCERLGQSGGDREAIAMLKAEHANVEAAWAYAVEAGWSAPLLQGGAFLGLSYESLGRIDRWSALLRAALARLPRDSVVWAVLEVHEASIDAFSGRHREAYARRAAAVEVLRAHEADDPFSLGWGLVLFAQSAQPLGRTTEARTALVEAVACFERAGRPELLALPYVNLLQIAETPEDHEHWFERTVASYRLHGEADARSAAHWEHGVYLATVHGEHGRGIAFVEDALAFESERGWYHGRIAALTLAAAELRAQSGDVARAAEQVEAYLRIWHPNYLVIPGSRGEALALQALLALQRGDDVEDLLRPDGEAARTHRGLLLRAESAGRRGAHLEARGCVDEALARLEDERSGRDRALWRVRALLAGAEVSRAAGERARAALDLRAALETGIAWHLLPSLLHALAVAVPWLPANMAADVAAFAAGHPAAPIAVRRRLAGVPTPTMVDYARDRDAAWLQVRGWAERVLAALSDAPPQAPSR